MSSISSTRKLLFSTYYRVVAAVVVISSRPVSSFIISNSYQPRSEHRKAFIEFVTLSTTQTKSQCNLHSYYTFRYRTSPITMSTSTSVDDNQRRILVPIANGSEEIETACITDTLVRFGAEVIVASVNPNREVICTMSRGLKFIADCSIDDVIHDEWDMIVLPGGMPGAEHLRDNVILQSILEKHVIQQQKYCGAICAAPAVVLASSNTEPSLLSRSVNASSMNGIISATCYPAPTFQKQLVDSGISLSDDNVVVSNHWITSKGPATALEFSLKLGELLFGIEKRNEIAKGMLTV